MEQNSPQINPCRCDQLIFNKDTKTAQSLRQTVLGELDIHMLKPDSSLHQTQKPIHSGFKIQILRSETKKLLEENLGLNL